MFEYYKLEGKTVIAISENDRHTLDRSFNNRRVLRTELGSGHIVSTVFLPIDHRYDGAGDPLVFETMVFENETNFREVYCNRYTSYDDAFNGHLKVLGDINVRGITAFIEGSTL